MTDTGSTSCATEAVIVEDVTRGCSGYENALKSNWNGNVSFGDNNLKVQYPATIEDLQTMVREANHVRVVGRGHSFTPLVQQSNSSDDGGTILCLQKLNTILEYQPPTTSAPTNGSITIEGGTTYTEVIQYLNQQPPQKRGALPNLPSCPQFTVAGAIATGTHGSGIKIHNLSAHVTMLEFVTANGELVQYECCNDQQENQQQSGCRVHLGCLGVISRLTLQVVPYYTVEAVRYDDLSLETMINDLPTWWTRCDSLSVWTSGFGQGVGKGTCWATFRRFIVQNNDSDEKNDETTAQIATTTYLTPEELGDKGYRMERSIPRYCTDPTNPEYFCPTGCGPWYDYLTVTMADGKETNMSTKDIQAEFFVPLQHAQAALRAVWMAVQAKEWAFSPPWGYQHDDESGGPPPQRGMVDAMEFRQVKAGDGAWLSPHNNKHVPPPPPGKEEAEEKTEAFLGIHISFNGDPSLRETIQQDYLPVIEEALHPYGVRPHWGKLATTNVYCYSRLKHLYGSEAIEQFQSLCQKHDPNGKFRNEFIKRCLFGEQQ